MRFKSLAAGLILLAGGGVFVLGQEAAGQTAHFYNVDTEQQVEGVIREILFEPRYEDRASFLILILEEKKSREIYRAEISPVWFFDHDLHVGESVKIVGSLYSNKDGNRFIIARELQSSGETFLLRDSRGFPTWRGGKMKRAGQRKGRGF
ncbi:MAG: hypothetical protein WBC70_05425 [Candidatus Aminicenantales bacterium]